MRGGVGRRGNEELVCQRRTRFTSTRGKFEATLPSRGNFAATTKRGRLPASSSESESADEGMYPGFCRLHDDYYRRFRYPRIPAALPIRCLPLRN